MKRAHSIRTFVRLAAAMILTVPLFPVTLIDENRTASIVIPVNATAAERFAAEELETYLEKITGKKPAIVRGTAGGVNIVLGAHPLNDDLGWKTLSPDEFIIDVSKDTVRIAGGVGPSVYNTKNSNTYVQERGTLYGVYEFLETLGVRWYRPEVWGEHVPSQARIELPAGRKKHQPGYRYRMGMHNYCQDGREQTADEGSRTMLWGYAIISIPDYTGRTCNGTADRSK